MGFHFFRNLNDKNYRSALEYFTYSFVLGPWYSGFSWRTPQVFSHSKVPLFGILRSLPRLRLLCGLWLSKCVVWLRNLILVCSYLTCAWRFWSKLFQVLGEDWICQDSTQLLCLTEFYGFGHHSDLSDFVAIYYICYTRGGFGWRGG